MIKFLCDAQLPPLLCKKLNENGYEATHVTDIGLLYAKDSEIWRYALNHTMVIMTKDSDFAQRTHLANFSPKVVWVRLPNAKSAVLVKQILPLMPQICDVIQQGERLVEIRQSDIFKTVE